MNLKEEKFINLINKDWSILSYENKNIIPFIKGLKIGCSDCVIYNIKYNSCNYCPNDVDAEIFKKYGEVEGCAYTALCIFYLKHADIARKNESSICNFLKVSKNNTAHLECNQSTNGCCVLFLKKLYENIEDQHKIMEIE
jgi:hypothetical protein